MTYIGQKTDPFIFSMNLKDIKKNNDNLINNNKEKDFSSSLSSQYKNEIFFLKKYIEKLNIEMRKKLGIEILPSLEEGFASFSKIIKNGEDNTELFENTINEWINKLLNVDYIDPLINLYENHIKNLEEELTKIKDINKNYEKTIIKIINENNDLRNRIQATEEELKNFLEVRNEIGDGSSMIIMDRDYMMKLEERNQLLSKENEILVVNYNKLQNDFKQLKSEIDPAFKNINDMKFQQLKQENLKLQNDNKILKGNFEINKQKVMEFANINNQLEVDNLKLKKDIDNMENTLNKYKEGNQKFYNELNNDN